MSSCFREQALFEEVPLPVAKGILGAEPAKALLFRHSMLLGAGRFRDLLLVEPRRYPGGELRLVYLLRNPGLLAGRVAVVLGPGQGGSSEGQAVVARKLGPHAAPLSPAREDPSRILEETQLPEEHV